MTISDLAVKAVEKIAQALDVQPSDAPAKSVAHIVPQANISAVLEELARGGVTVPVRCLAVPDRLIEHGDSARLRDAFELGAGGIRRAVHDLLERRTSR